MRDRPRVVVIGAGFGGLEVARGLVAAPVEVTVVDRNNFHTFQPLLYQVATSGLNAADVAHAVRGLFHGDGVEFRQGTVTGVDWERRRVELEGQDPLPFDHVVVATGSTTNYFGLPGAAEHSLPLYDLHDAVALRNHVLERFESAHVAPGRVEDGELVFTVIGGGPTGVETAGAMAELIDKVLRKDFPHLDVDRSRVVLVEMADALLMPFSEASRHHALEELEARGVEVRLGERVEEIRPDGLILAGGEVVPTRTVVWAAGVKAGALAGRLGVEQAKAGRVVVDDALRLVGTEGGWAVGDIAHVQTTDGPLPQLAPVAMQGGRHVARQIVRTTKGRLPKPFRYRDKGTMATIGRRAAVAELPLNIRLRGGPAWLAWLGLHLVFLVGKRNRASVLLNWAWNYFTWDRGPRIIFRTDEAKVEPPRRSGP